MSKILFVCTSNADRSPALEKYFSEKYQIHQYRSAGINKYHTSKKGNHYLTMDDIKWADIIVCAEQIHLDIITRDFNDENFLFIKALVLNCGEYVKGNVSMEYLKCAEEKIIKNLWI